MIKFRSVISVLCLLLAWPVQGDDLLQLYDKARQHDARYRAALMKLKGDLLMIDLSTSRYKPNITFTDRVARNHYESDQIDASQLDVSGCIDLACVVNRVTQLNKEGTQSTYDSQQASLLLTQPIYDATLLAENDKARAFASKARQEFQLAEQELIIRLVSAYLLVDKTRQMKRNIAMQIATADKLLGLAKKRQQLGVGKSQEAYEAQAFHDAQAMALLNAESAYAVALHELQTLVGGDVAGLATVSANMPLLPVNGRGTDEWLVISRKNNHGIQAAQALEQVNYFDLQAKKGAYLPKFTFAASYMDDRFRGGRGFSPESTIMAYGVEMKWPLYQGGGVSAANKQASYRWEESKEQLREVEQKVDAMVIGLVMAIDADIRRHQMALQLYETAKVLERVAGKGYQNGSASLLAWFDAQKKLAEAAQALAISRYDYVEHRLSLLRLSGELTAEELQRMNDWLVMDDSTANPSGG